MRNIFINQLKIIWSVYVDEIQTSFLKKKNFKSNWLAAVQKNSTEMNIWFQRDLCKKKKTKFTILSDVGKKRKKDIQELSKILIPSSQTFSFPSTYQSQTVAS